MFKRNKKKSNEPIKVTLQCTECKKVYDDFTYRDNGGVYPRCPRCGSYNVFNTKFATPEFTKSMQSSMRLFFIMWGSIILIIIIVAYFLISWFFF